MRLFFSSSMMDSTSESSIRAHFSIVTGLNGFPVFSSPREFPRCTMIIKAQSEYLELQFVRADPIRASLFQTQHTGIHILELFLDLTALALSSNCGTELNVKAKSPMRPSGSMVNRPGRSCFGPFFSFYKLCVNGRCCELIFELVSHLDHT